MHVYRPRQNHANRPRWRRILLVLAVAAWLGGVALSAQAGPLTRTVDPVVVAGSLLGPLHGQPIENVALFAMRGDTLEPIPFQVDQRRDGHYVLRSGPDAERDAADGFLDADDELALIAGDAGSARGDAGLPAGCQGGVEIALQDPVDGGTGYVYLLAFAGAAPRSEADYVVYDVAVDMISSTDYVVGYHPDSPISINNLFVPVSAGGSGQSVADRQKIRASATSIWNLVTISRSEGDFRSEVLAYTDGPVRVIRRTRNWMRLVWRIQSPSVELTTIYWKTGMQFPLRINVPFKVSRFFREVTMRIYVDTPPDVPGRVFYNRHNVDGVVVDGRMSERENSLNREPADWQVVAGSLPGHREGWFSRQLYDPEKVPVRLPVYYFDDATTADPPERFAGCFGCLGFELDGLGDLDAGSYAIFIQMFPMKSYRPGDETSYLAIHDHPLAVAAKPLPYP